MIVGDTAIKYGSMRIRPGGGRHCACLTVIARESVMDTPGRLAAIWLKHSSFVVHAYHAPQRCIPWRMFLDANFQLP